MFEDDRPVVYTVPLASKMMSELILCIIALLFLPIALPIIVIWLWFRMLTSRSKVLRFLAIATVTAFYVILVNYQWVFSCTSSRVDIMNQQVEERGDYDLSGYECQPFGIQNLNPLYKTKLVYETSESR